MTDRIPELIDNVDRAEALEALTFVTNLTDREFEIDREMSNYVLEWLEMARPAAVVELMELVAESDELLALDAMDLEIL